jgi:hypothetical protein
MKHLKQFESNSNPVYEEITALLYDLTDEGIRCDVHRYEYTRSTWQIHINTDTNLNTKTSEYRAENQRLIFDTWADKMIFITQGVKDFLKRLESCDFEIKRCEFNQTRNNDYYEIIIEKNNNNI